MVKLAPHSLARALHIDSVGVAGMMRSQALRLVVVHCKTRLLDSLAKAWEGQGSGGSGLGAGQGTSAAETAGVEGHHHTACEGVTRVASGCKRLASSLLEQGMCRRREQECAMEIDHPPACSGRRVLQAMCHSSAGERAGVPQGHCTPHAQPLGACVLCSCMHMHMHRHSTTPRLSRPNFAPFLWHSNDTGATVQAAPVLCATWPSGG